jgi:TonB-dependent starch-binding outer membrane protein SusC
VDFLQQTSKQAILPNRVTFGDLPQGSANSNPYSIYNWTAQGNANLNFTLTENLTSQTQVGAQYTRETYRGTQAFGAQLAPGTGSLAGTSARFAVNELNTDNVTLGIFAQQRFGWRDRMFLNLGVRGDRNSAFGQKFGFVYYPTANLSYVISDEEYFPDVPGMSSLQLRAAWGKSGQRPTFRDAITYFNPVAIRTDPAGSDVPAITFTGAGLGDVTLEPETSTETELGFDAAFLNGRLNATLTYYNKTTDNLLIQAPVALSVGAVATQFRNLGTLKNSGFEFQLGGTLYRSRPVTVDLTFGGNTNSNELTDIGGVAPIVVSTQQQHRKGYPAGGYWQRPYTFNDANSDGLVARTEIQYLADTAVYLGNPLPRREFQLQPALSIFENVRLSALFSYRGGMKLQNNTERFRCAFTQNCRAANDPTAPLADQARYIVALQGVSDQGFIEDGDFARLREVAMTLTAPQRWARRARLSNLSLTIAGRNLATWTDYTGLDPEITSTPGNNWANQEFLTVPPVKIWTARFNIGF